MKLPFQYAVRIDLACEVEPKMLQENLIASLDNGSRTSFTVSLPLLMNTRPNPSPTTPDEQTMGKALEAALIEAAIQGGDVMYNYIAECVATKREWGAPWKIVPWHWKDVRQNPRLVAALALLEPKPSGTV